ISNSRSNFHPLLIHALSCRTPMRGKVFKRKLFIAAIVLAMALVAVLLLVATDIFSPVQKKFLADGSVLILSDVSFAGSNVFLHGNQLERLLKNTIPSNGIAWSKFKLARPRPQTFSAPEGKSWLIGEF